MDGFYRKKGGVGELLAKEKIIFRPGQFCGGRDWQGSCTVPLIPVGGRGGEGSLNRLPHWYLPEYSRLVD